MAVKLIIAGGRDFDDRHKMMVAADKIFYYLEDMAEAEIVSGCAPGADTLGIDYADGRGIPVKRFPADWNGLGRKAGPIRNEQMAEYATHLLAFWDGKSRGTADMIERAKKHELKISIISY